MNLRLADRCIERPNFTVRYQVPTIRTDDVLKDVVIRIDPQPAQRSPSVGSEVVWFESKVVSC